MQYVNTLMNATGVADVAIIGIACKSIWAATENGNFNNITCAQVTALLGDLQVLQQNGLGLGNKKYTFVTAECEQNSANEWKWITISAKGDLKVSAVIHRTQTALILIEAANTDLKGPQLLDNLQQTVTHLVANNI